jgi:uncharacterized SAM-binding protein YcdF (DUF218 family)
MNVLKTLLEVTFSPVGIMVVLMCSGLLLSLWRPRSRAGGTLLIGGVALYLTYLFSPLSEVLNLNLERQYQPMLSPPATPRIDQIVLLSGYGEERPGFPPTSNITDQTAGCLAEGLRLHHLLPGSKLILSGGTLRRGQKPVAAIMADYLQQLGVSVQDIVIEGKSKNTYENLLEVKKFVGSRPFIVVAAACDMRRVMGVAHTMELNAFPAPACFWVSQYYPKRLVSWEGFSHMLGSFANPSHTRLSRLQWAHHELLGYVWYRLLGRIRPIQPETAAGL